MAELRSNLDTMSDQQLVDRLNAALGHTEPGASYLSDELWRRRSARAEDRMIRLTRSIEQLTWVVTAGTIGAICFAAATLAIAARSGSGP